MHFHRWAFKPEYTERPKHLHKNTHSPLGGDINPWWESFYCLTWLNVHSTSMVVISGETPQHSCEFCSAAWMKPRVGQGAFNQGDSFSKEINGLRREQGNLRSRSTILICNSIIQKEHGKNKAFLFFVCLFVLNKVIHNLFGSEI